MSNVHFDNVSIASLSGALPKNVQPVGSKEHPLSKYGAQFIKKTGVRQRHISLIEQTATDLGYAAVKKAMEQADWRSSDLDGIIFMSQTPDFNPAVGNAHVLHKRLNLSENTLAFDITLGCSSFPYGLTVCGSLLQQPTCRRLAMVSGDTMWAWCGNKEEVLNEQYFLFGEGCSALLLERSDNAQPIDICLHSDGSGYPLLFRPLAGVRNAWRRAPGILPNGELFSWGGFRDNLGYMDGPEITSFSTIRVSESLLRFVLHLGKSVNDYDGIILHQANLQILRAIAHRLGVDMTKVPTTIERFGNTSGASVTLTMVDAYGGSEGAPVSLLVSAFGIGLSWGEVSMTLNPSVVVPIFTTDIRFDDDFLKPINAGCEYGE